MAKSKKLEITPKRLVLFLISVLLVLTCTAGLIYHTVFYDKDNDVIPANLSNNADEPGVQYDVVEVLIFTEKLEKALKVNFAVADSGNKFSSVLLEAMSKAGIPSDKMQLVGDYCTSFMAFLREQGLKVSEDYSEQALALWREEISDDIVSRLNGFFEKTGLTRVEFGKFVYWFMYENSGSEAYTEVLDKIGVDNFVTLTVNTIAAANGLTSLKDGEATAAEARSFQSLCYSLGESYMSIVDAVGPSGVETFLGLTYSFAFAGDDIPESDRIIYNETIGVLTNKLGTLFDTFGYVLKNTSAITFELMAQAFAEAGDDILRLKAMASLSTSMKEGASVLYGYGTTTGINDTASAASKYAEVVVSLRRFVENFYGVTEPSDYSALTESTTEKITKAFAAMDKLAVLTDDDIAAMEPNELAEYIATADDLKELGTVVMDGLNDCILVVGVNLVMKIRNLEQYLDSDVLNTSLSSIVETLE